MVLGGYSCMRKCVKKGKDKTKSFFGSWHMRIQSKKGKKKQVETTDHQHCKKIESKSQSFLKSIIQIDLTKDIRSPKARSLRGTCIREVEGKEVVYE